MLGVKIPGVPQQFVRESVRVDGMIFADVDPVRFDAVGSRDEEGDRSSADEEEPEEEQNGKHCCGERDKVLTDESRKGCLRRQVFGFVLRPDGWLLSLRCGYGDGCGYRNGHRGSRGYLERCPFRIQSHVTGNVVCKIPFGGEIFAGVPAAEGVAVFGWCGRCGNRVTVGEIGYGGGQSCRPESRKGHERSSPCYRRSSRWMVTAGSESL